MISTLTGYLTQAVSSATGAITNQVSGYLPITINVPDLFTGVVNRVTTGYQYVQTTWQSRPSLTQVWQNRPVLFGTQAVQAVVAEEKPEYGPLS